MPAKHTAREVAEFVDGELFGDDLILISGIASPENAGPEDLIYSDSPRQLARAERSQARCIIAGSGVSIAGKTLLRTANPKLAFARAAAWLLSDEPAAAQTPGPPRIHSTALVAPSARLDADVLVGPYAVVEEGAEIGVGSEIGAFAFIGANAHIGQECRLHPRVTLYAGARLGNRVTVHSGVVLGSDGFGYVFGDGRYWKFPQIGHVEIGDDVEIGANTTIDRGALGTTSVGTGVKIDNLVQVAHNVSIGRHTVIAAQTGISGSSTIGDHAAIGGQVGIADHCTVEDGAIVGAQAGVPTGKKIRKGQYVWGTPARPMEKFKEQYSWLVRLPRLAARLAGEVKSEPK